MDLDRLVRELKTAIPYDRVIDIRVGGERRLSQVLADAADVIEAQKTLLGKVYDLVSPSISLH